ncbi:methyltransferase family protein [Agaribacterium haliotis]|uniref:methyltransferase family protein n=1 Tax=Agaribacterium haliotis TaxID=2013869 RepID=UPI000BB58CA8|nr:isoprenylcysteine carboxylmethyltransferase family protein [Agaribacterium haliotis]
MKSSMGAYDQRWVTDGAWLSGLGGAFAVVALAVYYHSASVLDKGLYLGAWRICVTRTDGLIFALLAVCLSMLIIEFTRLNYWHRSRGIKFFKLHPKLRKRSYFYFVLESLVLYFSGLLLLTIIYAFYRYAGEYGFQNQALYYQPWFRFVELCYSAYLYAGFPYVLITRAFKYSIKSDRMDYGWYMLRLIYTPLKNLLSLSPSGLNLTNNDKKLTLSILVKVFFAPLMTVFFFDQFPHFINNVGYLSGVFWGDFWQAEQSANYSHSNFNSDLYNISISFIFSIDVALAWCGYIVSSRWVDNQTLSTEATALGWLVCLLCYPPFQRELGLYFSPPSERQLMYLFEQQWLISVFLVLMLLSYLLYMLSTLCFGVRFSNLTNRGIIRSGPYAYIRHPAYASKNFAWWFLMFPALLYSAISYEVIPALLQCLGLLLMSWLYYWRALTEERHLQADPAYRSYCQRVKYRFIPGFL